MHLHQFTWQSFKQMSPESRVFVLPLGSTEQHGHHLPLSVDSLLVDAVARGVHDRLPDQVVLLPALWCGHSTHHMNFPGTVSVSQPVYQALIGDICGSLIAGGARKIFLLNGHGGNDVPVRYSLRNIKSQHRDKPDLKIVFASYWSLASETLRAVRESDVGGMGHACEMETSMMLFLHADHVHMDLARRDGPTQIPPYRLTDMQQPTPFYMVEEFHEISETGTVGAPELASADKGKRFYEGIVTNVAKFVEDFKKW